MRNNHILLCGRLLCSALLCPFMLSAQDILWKKSCRGKQADYLMNAKPTADYGFIPAGSPLSNKTGNKTDSNKGDLDYCIWKMDESRERLAAKHCPDERCLLT